MQSVTYQETFQNFNNVFRTSEIYIRKQFKKYESQIKTLPFDEVVSNPAVREQIWKNNTTFIEEIISASPHFRTFLLDLVQYEKAIWQTAFSDYDSSAYSSRREYNYKTAQRVFAFDEVEILKLKFKINIKKPFFFIETKWKWGADEQSLPTPQIPEGKYDYFLRPGMFPGTVVVKNMTGIHGLLPILLKEQKEFSGYDVLDLARRIDLEGYDKPTDEKELINDVITFLREQMVMFNTIELLVANIPAKQKKLQTSILI